MASVLSEGPTCSCVNKLRRLLIKLLKLEKISLFQIFQCIQHCLCNTCTLTFFLEREKDGIAAKALRIDLKYNFVKGLV